VNIITKKDLIRGVANRWRVQYPKGIWDASGKDEIYDQLKALDLSTATEDDIAQIIGNRSWTSIKCDGCGEQVDAIVKLGQPEDYESRTVDLCPLCVGAAFKLIQKHKEEAK
jgi:hypothetical protein